MLIIHMAHYKLKMHACFGMFMVMLLVIVKYALHESIEKCSFIWICTICGWLEWWMPKKYFSLTLWMWNWKPGWHHTITITIERTAKRCELIYMHMSSAFVPDLFWVRLDLLIEWHFDISCILNVCHSFDMLRDLFENLY